MRATAWALPLPLALAAAAALLQGCRPGGLGSEGQAPRPGRRQKEPAQERLLAVERFLAAGGADRCSLPRVDARGLAWRQFAEDFGGKAVVLTGLDIGGRWTREAFADAFGPATVRANNGRFDGTRSRHLTTVEAYLERNLSDSNVFHVEREVRAVLGARYAEAPPPLLQGFDYRPIFSLGLAGSPTYGHRHQETWLSLQAGRKAWWLGREGRPKARLPGRGDPCLALPASREALAGTAAERDFHLCVQQPGETVYFGNMTLHATCNLDPFVVAFGAQGHTEWLPPLHRAARHNATEVLEALLAGPQDPDDRDYMNRTALQHGVLMGHQQVAALLLRAGANATPGEPQPLQSASEFGDLPIVQLLLGAGVPLRERDRQGGTAAHYAAKGGHTAILEHLLSLRADCAARDAGGAEPLHWAASESSVPTLQFLVSRGGNVSARADDGDMPLHFAARAGHAELVAFLLAAGASPLETNQAGLTAAQVAGVFERAEVRELLSRDASAATRAEV